MGAGTLVRANAYVLSGVRTGAHWQVQYNATAGPDTAFEDFVSVFPDANVAGAVKIGEAPGHKYSTFFDVMRLRVSSTQVPGWSTSP